MCHNGRIFEYSAGKNRIGKENFDIFVAKYKKRGYNEYDAQYRALSELAYAYEFTFMELK